MPIAIKDMEMPKSCLDCPIRNYRDDEGNRCDLTGLYNREDCCPLVEIITCKDCKYWHDDGIMTVCDKHIGHGFPSDYYCANAKKKVRKYMSRSELPIIIQEESEDKIRNDTRKSR